jgi:SSS family solute:Na+ symporter
LSEQFNITGIDITIFIIYLALSRIIPLLFRGKTENSEDYFLGSRNFIWPLIGFSLIATNASGASFVGLAGAGYDQGISVYAYEWMTTVILVIFIFFILPFYLRSRVFTLPEFLSRRYDGRSRMVFSGFNLFANMFIDMAAALYAGSLAFKAIFPSLPLVVIVIGLGVLAGIYTTIGGLSAVMVSDTIQASVVILGGALIFTLVLIDAGGWDAATQAASDRQMSLILPADDPDLPWPGLFLGVLLNGLYFWTANQLIVQRSLGARSLDHGRWGAIFAGFMKLAFLFLFILPGTFALGLYPNLDNPDLVFPTLAFDLLPVGIRGLMLAALVAAVTSTVDSILNSASTLVTMDFVQNFRPQTSQAALVNIGRLTTVGALTVACIYAPVLASFDSLYGYLQSVLSYIVPSIVAVFLVGIMWTRITATAAFTTLVTMVPLGILFFIFSTFILDEAPIQFLYVGGIMFGLSLILLIGISLLGAAPDRERVQEVTWSPQLWREETEELRGMPLWKNYRFWSVALLISTFIIVFIFR